MKAGFSDGGFKKWGKTGIGEKPGASRQVDQM